MILEQEDLTGAALEMYRQTQFLPDVDERQEERMPAEVMTQLAFLPQPVFETRKRGSKTPKVSSMLHPVDKTQKARAKLLCGAGTIYNSDGAIRMYCGRRDCPYCFKRRYKRLAERIRGFARRNKTTMYWMKIDPCDRQKMTRNIRRNGGEYVCLPTKFLSNNRQADIIISDIRIGPPLHLDSHRLYGNLALWTDTREGTKVSFSSGFKVAKIRVGKPKVNFMAKLSLPAILPHALAVGADIKQIFGTYIHWEVDPMALMERLNNKNITAFQLTFGAVSSASLDEVIDNIDTNDMGNIFDSLPDAVALDSRGKVIRTGNVNLQHMLRNQYGVGQHNEQTIMLKEAEPEVSKGPSVVPG